MRKHCIFFWLILTLLWASTYAANDTITLQQGLNGYKGAEDTYIQSGWYVSSHATGGSAKRLLVGTS